MCADKTRQLVESANAIAIRSGSEGPGLFHTPDGVAYADVCLKGHRETDLVRSKEFRQRVAAKYFETTGGRAAATDLSAAIDIIEAKALQKISPA